MQISLGTLNIVKLLCPFSRYSCISAEISFTRAFFALSGYKTICVCNDRTQSHEYMAIYRSAAISFYAQIVRHCYCDIYV